MYTNYCMVIRIQSAGTYKNTYDIQVLSPWKTGPQKRIQASLPGGKQTRRPGINLSQSTFGFISLNCSSEHPCALEISQHESPDFIQYGVVLSGQDEGGGVDDVGWTTSRQISNMMTATSRKNGKMVRYALPFVYRRPGAVPYKSG
jgi:hypothetical protein